MAQGGTARVRVDEAERNKAAVRAFITAINRNDWAAVAAAVAPDFVRHSDAAGPPGVTSREDLIAFLRGERVTFPDAHETIEDLIAERDRVAARHRFTGTQEGPLGPYPPSGRRMSAEYLAIYRLRDGIIVEAWAEWDNLIGLLQLGHIPPGFPRG